MAKPTEQEIKDIRDASKQEKAYMDALTSTEPNEEKKNKRTEPTKARKMANEMELERTYPMASKMAKETPVMATSGLDALKGGLGIPLAMGADMLTGPKKRSEEDMSELTREVAKDKKYASGGSVSSRADGCAQRGKTKGKMVTMNRGGMSC